MYRIIYTVLCLLFWLTNIILVVGQNQFLPYDIPFLVNNQPLKYPLAGGINAPQLSEADFNNDGIKDLYIFDRAGNVHSAYINSGISNQTAYQFQATYTRFFPEIKHWALLRDYDKDGIADLFSYSTVNGIDGISVFKGYYLENTLAFQPYNYPSNQAFDILFFPLSNGTKTQIFVSKIDYPAIEDIDNDGDLDILTFNVAGGYLEYYKNKSIENGFRSDSLLFELEDPCFGRFYESGFMPTVDLSTSSSNCYSNIDAIEPRHSGSTVTALHLDEDCDMELLLGDLSFDNLIALYNAGDCKNAWMNRQDIDFPSYNVPAKVSIYPIAFSIDLNNDNKKDLVVSPNEGLSSENYNSIWYYQNRSSNSQPVFELQEKSLIVKEMLDFGSNTHPCFVDYNADGLLDIVVGTGGFYQGIGIRDARLFLYKNIGTATRPAFALEDDNYLNFNEFTTQTWNFSPTFGDLDNDGDLDLLVGEEFGTLFFAENIAGKDNPFIFSTIQTNYMGIDPGQVSAPFITDINEDGLMDILVGERNGNINYYQNIGTPTAPKFNPDSKLQPNTELFGRIDAREPGFVVGSSTPLIFQVNGKNYALTGTENGQLELYQARLDDYVTAFEKIPLNTNLLKVGDRTHPALADLNNDGKLELLIGNLRGGLSLFGTDFPSETSVSNDNLFSTLPITLYPNPNKGQVFWDTDILTNRDIFQLFDSFGKVVFQQTLSMQPYVKLPDYLSNGWYVVRMTVSNGSVHQSKLLLLR